MFTRIKKQAKNCIYFEKGIVKFGPHREILEFIIQNKESCYSVGYQKKFLL